MIIGGLEKLTLLDYPEHLAAIVFTFGCNFRCPFCYNPGLVLPEKKEDLNVVNNEDLLFFLKERFGRLEAVVISGGEPTLHKDLPEFIKKIKEIGYLVKLDTNGTNPQMLEFLIKESLIDYIAMDIKGCPEDYGKLSGARVNFKNIEKSVKIIMNSKLPYEFRTTLVPGLVNESSFVSMAKFIKGAKKWYLQNFKSDVNLIDPSLFNRKSFSSQEMDNFVALGKKFVAFCENRTYN